MPGKARVHELAKEFGVDSKTLLAKLKELGFFVKSASSLVEAPVARQLRECFPHAQRSTSPPGRPAPRSAVQGHAAPLPPVRRMSSALPPRPQPLPAFPSRRLRREWYRGTPPEGLTKYLLDHYVVWRRDPEGRPPGGSCSYFDDEVRQAKDLSAEWAPTLFDGLEFGDIVLWVREGAPAQYAGDLHRAGVRPEELSWSYEDRGAEPLSMRLIRGQWTVEMVVNEVERRRQLR